jgi:hypothetical protein
MIGIPRALLVVLTGLAVSNAGAQEFRWPDEPENLQVLPEGTKGLELVPDAIESYRSGLDIAPDDWKTFFEDKLRRLEPGLQF